MRMQVFATAVACGIIAGLAASAGAQPAASPPTPTFSKDVAPIFYAQCTSCHRPGEIAPMSLLTFKDARPWARSIAAKVASGAMPPWHADPSVHTDGWSIGQPDVILSMQEDYPIPATGTVAYQYFEVPANFDEDRWIKAWEMRPGNRRAVHHVIVAVKPPAPATPSSVPQTVNAPRPQPLFTMADGMEIPAGQTGGRQLPPGQRKPLGPNDRPRPRGLGPSIGGYVPGNSWRVFPEGTAIRLPAGSSLVFQVHYTPIGEATTDRTRLGLIFTKERPKTPLSSA